MLRVLTAIPGRRDDAVAIVNGLFGDALDDRDSGLATPMSIRAGETTLPLEPYRLAAQTQSVSTEVELKIAEAIGLRVDAGVHVSACEARQG